MTTSDNSKSVLDATFPVCLGGNVFGWTMDQDESFTVLDAYAAAGGNFVDTADVYSAWADGNTGGESECIIGAWMHSRHNRDRMIVATKVGEANGVTANAIKEGIEGSLRRLQTDYVDLYYIHKDDPRTPVGEILSALDALVGEGKVRAVAASEMSVERLTEALATSDRDGLVRLCALQPHYNLIEREHYEGPLRDLCERESLACIPYYSLARGFLTGKYRPGAQPETKRGIYAWTDELDDDALSVLSALDEIAEHHGVPVASVALAWLRAQPTVLAPIASARTVDQLQEILPMVDLQLGSDEIEKLKTSTARSAF